MDWTKSPSEQVYLSTDSDVIYGKRLPVVSKEKSHIKFTICNRQLVQGYLRDKQTGRPLPRRRITAYATINEETERECRYGRRRVLSDVCTRGGRRFEIHYLAADEASGLARWPARFTQRTGSTADADRQL